MKYDIHALKFGDLDQLAKNCEINHTDCKGYLHIVEQYACMLQCVKTHLRNMVVVPEMIGSIVGVYNGKTYNQVEIKVITVFYVCVALYL